LVAQTDHKAVRFHGNLYVDDLIGYAMVGMLDDVGTGLIDGGTHGIDDFLREICPPAVTRHEPAHFLQLARFAGNGQ